MSISICLIETTKCPECGHVISTGNEVFDINITNNLYKMATAALIGEHIWAPNEIGIKLAKDLIEPLTKGIKFMKESPIFFEQFNAKNGWGTYEQFLPWLEKYLIACKDYPEARIEYSR